MSHKPRVALVTSREYPALEADDAALPERCAALGVEATPVVWDDKTVAWDSFDLAVIRSAWDYARHRDQFLEWARSVPRVENPAAVVEWNTDKHYPKAIEAAGVPVVHTDWLEPEQNLGPRGLHTRFPASGDFVLKPAISAGSADTGRYTANDSWTRGLAVRHAERLLTAGHTVMLQRYIASVETSGEAALVFIDGAFTWASRRAASLFGPDQEAGPSGSIRDETVNRHEATATELAVAQAALAAAASLTPGFAERGLPFLYARVDLLEGESGPQVSEISLTEPSLHMGLVQGGRDVFARAIAARVGR